MKKGSFFQKLLAYILCACLLAAVLTGVLAGANSVRILTGRIAQELTARALSLSAMCSQFIDGNVMFDLFYGLLASEMRGARVYVYDAQGGLLLWSDAAEAEEDAEVGAALAAQVIAGGREPAVSMNWRRGVIAAGAPVLDNFSRVNGAVVLVKPAGEVRAAVWQIIGTVLASVAISAAIMLLPAFFGSRRIASPIRQMTGVALRMSGGDFTARADESYRGEIGVLGGALNHLSGELSATISNLLLARARLSSILSGIGDGVLALDADLTTVAFCNPAAQRLLRAADGSDQTAAFVRAHRETFAAALEADGPQEAHWSAGGRELLLTCSRSQDEADSAPGVVVLLRDVTAAERLEQTRRDYVANVSHELRTPIASIRSLAEALDDGLVRTDEDRARYYGYILRESLRLSRLIDDLLELSRLQSGTVALERSAFDLNELAAQVAERMRVTASYSGIDLRYTPAAALPPCLSNRDRIEQVLVALLDNAIKYASDDGVVEICCRSEGERLRVEVSNSGHIDEADLPHLFERFYKADRAHAGQGTGLGLAIAREVLERLDGSIEAFNRDGFAVFSFTVPAAPPGDAAPQLPPPEKAQ